MKKYVQKVIPRVSTKKFENKDFKQLVDYIDKIYQNKYLNKSVVNADKDIRIIFLKAGKKKTAYGSNISRSKVACMAASGTGTAPCQQNICHRLPVAQI
jgi:hypothetical protein